MGSKLYTYWKESVSKEIKWAFVSTFVIGVLVHMYKFTNTLLNHDSLYNFYSDQNVLGSGRWALSLACGISSYYDLPWLNGILSILWIAMTVVVIVALFNMKNPVLIILTGAILATSTATTETFQFMFTADGYMLAMFLSAIAVYCMRMGERRPSRLIFGGICICVVCGIYQAYVSFALVLALCHFIYELFRDEYSKKERRSWICHQLIVYPIALGVYYGIWKLCLWVTDTAVNDYQGIAEVGKINLELIINGIKSSIITPVFHWLQWNVFEHGWTLYAVLNVLFLIGLGLTIIFACIKTKIFKSKERLLLLVLCLVALLPFSCIWHFTSNEVGYAPRMLQSLYLLYILAAVLCEQFGTAIWKNVICVLLVVIVGNNAVMANISYYYMHLENEQTYAEAVGMMSDIREWQEEYDVKQIAVVGKRISDVQLANIDEETGEKTENGNVYIVTGNLETSLLYDHEHTLLYLEKVMGLQLERLSTKEADALAEKEEIKALEVWPSKKSITVIDDILVIRIAETLTKQ